MARKKAVEVREIRAKQSIDLSGDTDNSSQLTLRLIYFGWHTFLFIMYIWLIFGGTEHIYSWYQLRFDFFAELISNSSKKSKFIL
jgi:hypothetical protein